MQIGFFQVEELFTAVERLVDFPKSGRTVPEVGSPRIRKLIFGTYRVSYSVKEALNNVSEAVRARQKSAKKRSLQVVNEHFELIFNNVLATQVIMQCFLKDQVDILTVPRSSQLLRMSEFSDDEASPASVR